MSDRNKRNKLFSFSPYLIFINISASIVFERIFDIELITLI
jgi:hypothetical protein